MTASPPRSWKLAVVLLAACQPEARQPGASQPGASQPAASQPAASQPGAQTSQLQPDRPTTPTPPADPEACQRSDDCTVTAFTGCCACCPCSTPYAIRRDALQEQQERCAIVDCDFSACDEECSACPATESFGAAACRQGRCVIAES